MHEDIENGIPSSLQVALAILMLAKDAFLLCSGIDLNHRLGSLELRVVCGAFCLGGGSWVRELYY